MSKGAVEQFVKDERGKTDEVVKIELDLEMQFLFHQLKKKLGNGLSNKETLRKLLHQLTENIKEPNSKKIPGDGNYKSRYIPINNKRMALQQTSGKCSFERCTKPHDHIHHISPYSESKNHHPKNLMPLCKEHHELVHNKDPLYLKYRLR